MNYQKYLIELRESLVKQVGVIKNSNGGWLHWDDTKSNMSIRHDLVYLLQKYVELAEKNFGIFLILKHAHGDCDSYKEEDPYWVTKFRNGADISYEDDNYEWTEFEWTPFQDSVLDFGSEETKHPCPLCKNRSKEHQVWKQLVIDRKADVEALRVLASCLCSIRWAIDSAEEKKTRSGIRERLLLVIARLTDVILEVPVEVQIDRIVAKL